MMQYVIGVDAGATKTAATVFSAQDGSLTARNGREGGAAFFLRFYKEVV